MSATLIATVCGIITAIGFGAGDWLTGKASKSGANKFELNLAVQLYGTALLLPFLLTTHIKLPTLGQTGIMLLVAGCITTAYMLMIKALVSGSIGTVIPIIDSYPLPALLLSVVFLSARFSGWQIVSMLSIILGVIILAYEKNHRKIALRKLHEANILAAVSMLFYGMDFFLIGTIITKMAWQIIDVTISVMLVVIASVLVFTYNRQDYGAAVKRALFSRLNFYTGISFSIGAIAFYIGSHRAGSIVIPTVLSACAPLVASILGAVFDHEKIGPLRRLGAVIVVAGIIILNIDK